MARVIIDSGQLPSAEGVAEGYDLSQVVGRWQSIAYIRFPDDCRFLLQMIEETDRLRLWEKNVGGFRFKNRDDFLRRKVLINYELTERQLVKIVAALKGGRVDEAQSVFAAARSNPLTTHGEIGRGRNRGSNTTSKDGDRGQTYTLRRLARDRPDLLDRVESGNLSATAAAIEAGFRRRVVQITDADPQSAADRIRQKLGDEFAEALGTALCADATSHRK